MSLKKLEEQVAELRKENKFLRKKIKKLQHTINFY